MCYFWFWFSDCLRIHIIQKKIKVKKVRKIWECCVSFGPKERLLVLARFPTHSFHQEGRGQPPRPLPAVKMDPSSLLAPSSAGAAGLITGFQVALCTLTLTALLELFSTKTVASLLKTTPGLYRACVRANLVNNLAIGPPTYALATEFFVYKSDPGYSYSLLRSALATVGLVVTHALGYHYAHSQMHRPQMYWAHKFHHAFAKHVTPSSANAVSVVEYAYAYMLPFVVGCAVCAPDERALLTAVAVISVNNLLIHTPALEVGTFC